MLTHGTETLFLEIISLDVIVSIEFSPVVEIGVRKGHISAEETTYLAHQQLAADRTKVL